MAEGLIDEELRKGLPPAVATALAHWAADNDHHYGFDRWLVNGRSGAQVALVRESDRLRGTVRRLLMKVDSAKEESFGPIEFTRHRRARADAEDFAARHLSHPVHGPVRVDGTTWITFQTIAGETFDDVQVLTVLLRRMLDQAPAAPGLPVYPPRAVTDCCVEVVRAVLAEWAVHPWLDPDAEPLSVGGFLAEFVPGHLAQGGRLHEAARRHQGEQIVLDDEPGPLPNPFAAAQGGCFSAAPLIRPLRGRCHGDLHTDNTLVRAAPLLDLGDFYLIDNAHYRKDGLLARDPVHLVLYVVARTLDTVSAAGRSALIDLLLDPRDGPAALVPGWLGDLVTGVERVGSAWVEPSGLVPEWRQQTLLSLAGCALVFLGRASVPEADKPWFLRLAARALQQFAERNPGSLRSGGPAPTDPGVAATGWIAALCLDLPAAAAEAARQGEARTAELEELRDAALSGLDRTEAYREFVRSLGGPDPDPRYGTRGTEGRPEAHEAFVCPLGACARRERREPGEARPSCHLGRDGAEPLLSTLG
ncbi:hypothetical protein AB0M29_35075 [Streptomyces sp. NPDC051976]|uniref:hypothetical protein n=1 Tax=Streptomyces sp. NPDC051976 TaxID=3154947 RepID=UPI00343E881F